MARFTQPGGSGSGEPGPQGPQGPQGDPGADGADGNNGANGADFGIYYLGNYNPNSGYLPNIAVVRGSDGQLYLAKASGQLGDPINYQSNGQWEVWIPKGADGADGSDGAAGADGEDALWNFLGEWENGIDYAAGSVVEYQGSSYYHPTGQFSSYSPPGYGWLLVASKGDQGIQGETGLQGVQGETGAQGEPCLDGDPLDFLNVASNIVPTQSNFYTLGTTDKRWADVYLGPNTINIIDQSLGTNATMGIDNGVFFINGIAQAQLPNLAVTHLTFNDNSVQTTAYIPGTSGVPVETSFTVNGGSLGTMPTFNGAPLFSGSYVKTGKLVHFQIQVDMDNITNFGTGQYYVDLPFPAKYGYKFREGCLHDISATKDYEIGGHVYAGESRLNLTSTDASGNTVYDIPFVHNNPTTLSTADNFHISGTYIAD